MNLTHIIEATGKRVRRGKLPANRLTNAEIKEVLETAIEVLKEGLIREGRVEIQGFAVLEVRTVTIQTGELFTKRQRWVFRPSRQLREQTRTKQRP
jgi:nucleoid DNA-binding protein